MQADWCLLLANTDTRPELAPHRNKSLIIVPMKERGIERRLIDKMGCRSSDTAQLFFDEVSNAMMKFYISLMDTIIVFIEYNRITITSSTNSFFTKYFRESEVILYIQVRVPKTHVVGELNQGFIYQMLQFQEERMWGVASSTSILILI